MKYQLKIQYLEGVSKSQKRHLVGGPGPVLDLNAEEQPLAHEQEVHHQPQHTGEEFISQEVQVV